MFPAGEEKGSVCNACERLTSGVRVPTVPEKQIDRIRNEAKYRLQIYTGGKYKVVYIDDARQLCRSLPDAVINRMQVLVSS